MEKAFRQSKELLTSTNLLTHYDPSLPLTLPCDASAYGIGAVLAHRMPDSFGETGRLCITYSHKGRTKLFAVRERGSLMCVWNQEIPQLPAWTSFRVGHRPQTTTGSVERRSFRVCASIPSCLTLVIVLVCLWVYIAFPRYKGTC